MRLIKIIVNIIYNIELAVLYIILYVISVLSSLLSKGAVDRFLETLRAGAPNHPHHK